MAVPRRGSAQSPSSEMAGLLTEVVAESYQRTNPDIDILTYTKKILRFEPWVTQRAIMKAMFPGSTKMDSDEYDLLMHWREQGKTNWEPDTLYKNFIIEAGMRSSKCVPKKTLIPTNQGVLMPHELLPTLGEGDVPELETHFDCLFVGTRHGTRRVNAGLSQRPKDGYRILTRRGYSLGGSKNHPVQALHPMHEVELARSNGRVQPDMLSTWKPLEEVVTQHGWVMLARGNTVWGEDRALGYAEPPQHRKSTIYKMMTIPQVMSPQLGRWLGFVMARTFSWARKEVCALSVANSPVDALFRQDLYELFGIHESLISYNKVKHGETAYLMNWVRLHQFLAFLGLPFGVHQDALEVPRAIRQGSRETLREFLKMFLLARVEAFEDSAYVEGTRFTWWHGSMQLVRQIASLLLLFGVKCRIAHRQHGPIWAYQMTFEDEDLADLKRYVFGQEIFQTPLGDPVEVFADRVVRHYDLHEPLYDLCVPDGHEYIANGFVVHNTALASFIITYLFYRLITMDNPAKHYKQLPGQPFIITCVATTEGQSKDTIYAYCQARIKESPFYQNLITEGKIKVGETRIVYPDKKVIIRAGHSNQDGLVGTTAPALCMDEANRFASETGTSGYDMYQNVGKATSTFAPFDDMGFRIVISSAYELNDVTHTLITKERQKMQAGKATRTLFFDLKTFDMNPNLTKQDVIEVYENDLAQALRDYENIRIGANEKIFNEGMLQVAVNAWKDNVQGQRAVFEDGEVEENGQMYVMKKLLHVDPAMRGYMFSYAALDPAISGDSYALCIGHGIADPGGHGIIAVIDVLTKWTPKLDHQGRQHLVLFNNVEDLFLELALQRGVLEVHSDRYNSEGSLQLFNRNGIIPVRSSDSRKVQYSNYMDMKVALNQKKVWLPDDPQLFKEARHVELVNGYKVDHPEVFDDGTKGGKDLCDVVAKVVARILKDDGKLVSYHEAPRANGAPRPRSIGYLPPQVAAASPLHTALGGMNGYAVRNALRPQANLNLPLLGR